MPIIAPSLLASNFLRLQDEAQMLNNSEADWFHLDVMDGRFVPNISFGLPIIQQLRITTKKVFDVHLMIEAPENYTEAFKKAGADIITVHYEACVHLHRNIQQIKRLGMKAGVALNPHTPVGLLENILQDVDMVLLMSVNPGFGGQHFIPETIAKITALKQMIASKKLPTLIEIDGGVTLDNAALLVVAGADVLVAGSSIFNSPQPIATIKLLKQITHS
ncbi:MAG: ribulose-phosphate 3-epimerase [Deinococcales bacterium]|nr:ribulose-phosphate 3-epimerase [Chitinophagaceae bacterium]